MLLWWLLLFYRICLSLENVHTVLVLISNKQLARPWRSNRTRANIFNIIFFYFVDKFPIKCYYLKLFFLTTHHQVIKPVNGNWPEKNPKQIRFRNTPSSLNTLTVLTEENDEEEPKQTKNIFWWCKGHNGVPRLGSLMVSSNWQPSGDRTFTVSSPQSHTIKLPSPAIVRQPGCLRCLLLICRTNLQLSSKHEILFEAITISSPVLVNATDEDSIGFLLLISVRYVPSKLNSCTLFLSATATFSDFSSIAIEQGYLPSNQVKRSRR